MTFYSIDIGEATSEPILAFRFDAGSTVLRYTSAAFSVTIDSEAYDPDVISVEPLELKPNQTDQRLTILTRQDLPVVSLLQNIRPRVRVRIYQSHVSDLTAWQVYWTGAIVGVSRDGVEARVIADAGTGRIDGLVAPQKFGASCQWTLGRPWCPVDLGGHTFTGVLTAIGAGGRELTASAWAGKGAGYFVNGHVLTSDGRAEVITAYDDPSGKVTLRNALAGLDVGDSVVAVAGCDGAQSTCEDRFGSETNDGAAWGGFRIPIINPHRASVR